MQVLVSLHPTKKVAKKLRGGKPITREGIIAMQISNKGPTGNIRYRKAKAKRHPPSSRHSDAKDYIIVGMFILCERQVAGILLTWEQGVGEVFWELGVEGSEDGEC